MKARLLGTIALVMLPTLASAGAGRAGAPTSSATAPDNAKAAGTGGGEGAAMVRQFGDEQ